MTCNSGAGQWCVLLSGISVHWFCHAIHLPVQVNGAATYQVVQLCAALSFNSCTWLQIKWCYGPMYCYVCSSLPIPLLLGENFKVKQYLHIFTMAFYSSYHTVGHPESFLQSTVRTRVISDCRQEFPILTDKRPIMATKSNETAQDSKYQVLFPLIC